MADINNLLESAAAGMALLPQAKIPDLPSTATIPATVQAKKAEVAQASDLKKQAMGAMPTQYEMSAGSATDQKGWHMSDLERDIRQGSATDLVAKYGSEQGNEMIRQRAAADGQVFDDQSRNDRTNFDWSMDNTKAVGSAAASSLGGIGSYGLGLVSDKAGTYTAQKLTDFNQYVQDSQSSELKAKRRLSEGKTALDTRDNRVQEQVDIENGDTPLVAGLSRIGRDTMDAVGSATMDSATFQDGTANAVGSLLSTGPLAKVIKLGAAALVPGKLAAKAAAGGTAAERALAQAAEKAPVLAAMGAMEGGGAYQQVVSDVMGRSHDDLMKDSPTYRAELAKGEDTPERRQAIKESIANNTGLLAAAITAPTAALIGGVTGVAGFEGNPFAHMGIKKAVNEIIKQPIEEGLQGAASQLAQNFAETKYANENKDMVEGVGRQVGEGALYGLGMAGLVEAPNLVRYVGKTTKQAAAQVGANALDSAGRLLDKVSEASINLRDKNEATAENSEGNIAAATPKAMTYAQELEANMMTKYNEKLAKMAEEAAAAGREVTPEETASVPEPSAFLQKFRKALTFDPADVSTEAAAQLEGSVSRAEAAFKLADMFKAEQDPEKKAALAMDLVTVMQPVFEFGEKEGAGFAEFEEGSEGKAHLEHVQSYMQMLSTNPALDRAVTEAGKIFDARTAEQNKVEVTDASVQTPEGLKDVQKAIAIATVAPTAANLETVDAVLYQASKGTITLSPEQSTALKYSKALLDAAKVSNEQAVKLGTPAKQAAVASNIASDQGAKGESALDYAKTIFAAYKGGEPDLAAARLGNLFNFAKSHQNKVAALNSHFEGGNPSAPNVHYETIKNGGREDSTWFNSKAGMYVRPATKQTVEFAQKVADEAALLANVYNGLVDAFPDLDAQHIPLVPLNSELMLPADEVVAKYRSSKAGNSSEGQNATTVPKVTPQVKTAQNETVPDVKTPVAPKVEAPVKTVAEVKEAPVKAEPVDYAAKLSKLNDAELDERLSQIERARTKGNSTVELEDEYQAADAEMSRREDAAQAEIELQEAEEAKAAEPKKKGLDAVYPDLITFGKDKINHFKNSYKLASKQISRLVDTGAPIDLVADALKNSAALTALIGSEPRHKLTPEIVKSYQKVLDEAQGSIQYLTDRVNEFLDAPHSKSDSTTRREYLLAEDSPSNTQYQNFRTGRLLSLFDLVDGELVPNKELIEGAALAAQSFVLNLDDYVRDMEAKDVTALTSIPEQVVTDGPISRLSDGLTINGVKQALGRKIQDFWGLQINKEGSIGIQRGILESVTAEMLGYLTREGGPLVQRMEVFTEEDGLLPTDQVYKKDQPAKGDQPAAKKGDKVPNVRRVTMFKLRELEEGQAPDPITAYPTAIDDAVLTEPVQDFYIGEDAKVPVAQMQMRNNLVENTPNQKEAIAAEQATRFFANWTVGGLWKAMGKDGVMDMFGAGDMTKKVWNKNHAKSLDGRNRGIAAAYDQMMIMLDQVQNVGEQSGTDYFKTAVRFAYNVTRVGRLQMMGKQNPQANKMMRALFSPTQSTLDLSNENNRDFERFALGLGQALGIKVHKESDDETIIRKLKAIVDGSMKETVDTLANWQMGLTPESAMNPKYGIETSTMNAIKANFKAAGVDLTADAFHALVDYGRYREAVETRGAFETSVYLEADGVTNGPINAMVLFTTGPFTPQWIRNVAKGGLYFNQPGRTLNEHNKSDKADLYTEAKDNTNDELAKLREVLKTQDNRVNAQMDHLLKMMDMFFGKDLSFDADTKTLTLERGITKNPLTITIYGSGARGIAAKLSKTMIDAIYERMSEVAQRKSETKGLSDALAMFPESSTEQAAQAKLAAFTESLSRLTTQKVVHDKLKRTYKLFGFGSSNRNFLANPTQFTFSGADIQNIQSAMLALFVEPMTKAIEATVGSPLLNTADLMRRSIQAQSIILEDFFKLEVAAALADKAKDPNWRPDDFLTHNELDAIYDKLAALSPFIDTGTQRFFVAGSTDSEIGATSFGSGLGDEYRSDARVDAPGDAGVSGVPYMNIGTGDGYMMQLIATMQGALQNTLKIFDGMNMPLDKIEEGSLMANEAVLKTWMANPLKAVQESFASVMSATSVANMSPEGMFKLAKVLADNDEQAANADSEAVHDFMDLMNEDLTTSHIEIEARHRAMARLHMSIDQMAAARSPFQHKGKIIPGTDADSISDQLNIYFFEELAKLKGTKKDITTTGSEFDALATVTDSGAKILRPADLKNLSKVVKLPGGQDAIFNLIVNGLSLKGFTVIYGSHSQIVEYSKTSGRKDIGVEQSIPGEIGGVTVMSDKSIYLIDRSTETLVHELMHAATYYTVVSFYTDKAFAKANPQGAAAVKRIERLMEQFVGMRSTVSGNLDSELLDAYNHAVSAIEQYNGTDGKSKAMALNEFMSWGLSNPKLEALLKQTTATKLALISKQLVALIKSMFVGTRSLPDPKQDMYSNLLFNSSMLMFSQPRLSRRLADTNLFQSTQYGDNVRLTQVNEAFNMAVGRYASTDSSLDQVDSKVQMSNAVIAADEVADMFEAKGFPMTMQEGTTFRAIVGALATEALINPNAMAAAQQLYTHVIQNLNQEDFIDPTDTDTQRAEYNANQKYNVLIGNFGSSLGAKGRTSILPAFLALATTNESFREILSKIDKPKFIKNTEGTLDSTLENLGNEMMEALGNRMAGISTQPTSVKQAIDALNVKIAKTVQQREHFMETAANRGNQGLDAVNDKVVELLTAGSDIAYDKAAAIKAATNSRWVKLAASAVQGTAALVNEDKAQKVAEGVLAGTNMSNIWGPLKKLIQDSIGRTASNANIYDMIKITRSAVQKMRQQFREDLPPTIAKKFSRKLTKEEWTSLTRSLGRTDIASLEGSFTQDQILEMLSKPKAMRQAIASLEGALQSHDAANFKLLQKKMNQLATYMNTGRPGTNLLRNAEAISGLHNETVKTPFQTHSPATVKMIDSLTSLYAIEGLNQTDKESLVSLVQSEADGLKFTMSYLVGQREEELRKAESPMARMNGFKGYIPVHQVNNVSMIVADNTERTALMERSYVQVAGYEGSSSDPYMGANRKSYFFAPVASRAGFEQGILQNVRQSASGVDATTGLSLSPTAGTVTEAAVIKKMLANIKKETGAEPLMPVINENGTIVALERSVNPDIMSKAYEDGQLHEQIGVWRGRQAEEATGQAYNETLIDKLKKMYDEGFKSKGKSIDKEYTDLLASDDPIIKDAMKLMNQETRDYVKAVFGDRLMVRNELLDDVLGYRAATIGDAWTGNSRWNPKTQETVKNLAILAFGNSAYAKFVNSERIIQNAVSDAKVLIVVKSVIVPMANIISNIYQLISRAVPGSSIAKSMPVKTAELTSYIKNEYRMKVLEAELRAATNNPNATLKLQAEMTTILDANKRLTIWPLIEAGEFSSVSDVGITREDILLSEGRLAGYIEGLVNKLPPALATAGRYGLVTKDTALFQGLQKTVEYGDFLAKAIYFDDLTKRKGMTQAEALGRITEEFVNYDRLAGRDRGYLESIGMLWFPNFKIRIMKIAASTIRNNPVHALFATLAPAPEMFGSVGLPTSDSLINKLMDGSISYSVGPTQGLSAFGLNPWNNLVN